MRQVFFVSLLMLGGVLCPFPVSAAEWLPAVRLDTADGNSANPTYAPDGSLWVFYTTLDGDGDEQLMRRIRAAGGGIFDAESRVASTAARSAQPLFFDDGTVWVAMQNRTRLKLYSSGDGSSWSFEKSWEVAPIICHDDAYFPSYLTDDDGNLSDDSGDLHLTFTALRNVGIFGCARENHARQRIAGIWSEDDVISPVSNDRIAGVYERGDTIVIINGRAVRRSTDNGATYATVESSEGGASGAAQDEDDPNLLYAVRTFVNGVPPEDKHLEVIKSTDFGVTWSVILSLDGSVSYVAPKIATSKGIVAVAWATSDSDGMLEKLMVAKSHDAGVSFGSAEEMFSYRSGLESNYLKNPFSIVGHDGTISLVYAEGTPASPLGVYLREWDSSPQMLSIRNQFNTFIEWRASDGEDGANLSFSYRIDGAAFSTPARGNGANRIALAALAKPPGTYTLFAKAIDSSGKESAELSVAFTVVTRGGVDDADNDGLSDADEAALGSNPLLADTDGDGVDDGDEAAFGSKPTDAGSFRTVVPTDACVEWNGFLGMFNILETTNRSGGAIAVESRLFDIVGDRQDVVGWTLDPARQVDLLVHGLDGRSSDSYGVICTRHGSSAGDIDGRMVYYKPAVDGGYEFAFAVPFAGGLAGRQFVSFNTFHPSLSPEDAEDAIANWVQITNLESSTEGGALTFYGFDGTVLSARTLSLGPGARFDSAAHELGRNMVGLVAWEPDRATARFLVRNVRYVFDNPGIQSSFDSAFQLGARCGSGELLAVPLDTGSASSIIEVSNVLGSPITATVSIYNADGALIETLVNGLPAHGSWHIIADSLLAGGQGMASIRGSEPESIVSLVMQYGRTPTGGVQYIYGIDAAEPLGGTLSGSYNTFLEQGCSLLLVNPSESAVSVELDMLRFDGSVVLSDRRISVPARGIYDFDLCAQDIPDVYGTITAHIEQSASIIGAVVRKGREEQYRFPTLMRP